MGGTCLRWGLRKRIFHASAVLLTETSLSLTSSIPVRSYSVLATTFGRVCSCTILGSHIPEAPSWATSRPQKPSKLSQEGRTGDEAKFIMNFAPPNSELATSVSMQSVCVMQFKYAAYAQRQWRLFSN